MPSSCAQHLSAMYCRWRYWRPAMPKCPAVISSRHNVCLLPCRRLAEFLPSWTRSGFKPVRPHWICFLRHDLTDRSNFLSLNNNRSEEGLQDMYTWVCPLNLNWKVKAEQFTLVRLPDQFNKQSILQELHFWKSFTQLFYIYIRHFEPSRSDIQRTCIHKYPGLPLHFEMQTQKNASATCFWSGAANAFQIQTRCDCPSSHLWHLKQLW